LLKRYQELLFNLALLLVYLLAYDNLLLVHQSGGKIMALTELQVKNAKPTVKQYKLSDGGGLFMLVHSNGGRYWRLAYRFGGKEKRLAFGVYPDVSLAQARERRDDACKLLARG
jgi:hypothetical protein